MGDTESRLHKIEYLFGLSRQTEYSSHRFGKNWIGGTRWSSSTAGNLIHDALLQIRTLYFDIARAANAPALAATRALADPKHILFGTDFPYMPAARTVDDLARGALPGRELRDIETKNANALIPQLKGSTA